jgi:hypothetical protein
MLLNKMKNKKYHTLEIVPKSNNQTVERGTIDTLNTHMLDRSLSCLGTGISIKRGRVKLM